MGLDPRNTGRTFLLLAVLVLAASDAAAQALVQSFADLQPLIKPGQQMIVWDDDGRKITGGVVSLTGNQLEIQRWRWITLAPLAGGLTGGAIDAAHNRPLYISPRAGGVTLVPLLGRERAGLAARIRF